MGHRLLYWWVKIAVQLFFRKIIVTGKENIPANKPIIYALNHQNTLLDALVMAVSIKQPIYFMTRADIFKKEWISNLLKSLHLIPIYRIRDGYSAVSQNEQIFDYCYDLLKENKHILIFPEGFHLYQKKLRPLKKGIARMAIDATIRNQAEVMVIPVGLNYGTHKHSRSWVQINIGEPISTQSILDQNQQHEAKAVNQLVREIYPKLQDQMVHTETTDSYRQVNNYLLYLSNTKQLPFNQQFDFQKTTSQKINMLPSEDFHTLTQLVSHYQQLISKLKLNRTAMGVSNQKATIGAMVLAPLLLFFYYTGSMILFPALLCYKALISKFKDKHWEASMKVISIMTVYPIWLIILKTLILIFIPLNYAIILLSIIALSLITYLIGKSFADFILNKIRLIWIKNTDKSTFSEFQKCEQQLLDFEATYLNITEHS
jgi:1-acyl-sn-glycerol-3-phosphate acyltransferase